MEHRLDRGRRYLAGTMLGGLMLVGVIAIVVLISFSRHTSVHLSTSSRGRKIAYRPREVVDTVGFASVVDRIQRWALDTSLEEISRIWDRVGYRNIEEIDRALADTTNGWLDIFVTCFDYTTGDVVKGLIGQPHKRLSNRLFHNIGSQYRSENDHRDESPFHHCLIVIEQRLHKHRHGGALSRIEPGIKRSIADGEQLSWVGVAPAKLVVLFAIKCRERDQLARVGTTADQGANDERDPVSEV